ncbi:hypothetical protein [Stenotrophomonas sp. PS02298]|uniref:hypothetical protein n=1 Tax=Stenotrophomonas sp. PS02298 TaxID=2991424 RepID=UPI002499EAED|nr:hypothetical protein [Stenotrophomonas sp. PS02298]
MHSLRCVVSPMLAAPLPVACDRSTELRPDIRMAEQPLRAADADIGARHALRFRASPRPRRRPRWWCVRKIAMASDPGRASTWPISSAATSLSNSARCNWVLMRCRMP